MILGSRTTHLKYLALTVFVLTADPALKAQGTLADYERAQGLQAKARHLVVNTPGAISWIGESNHFWYPRSVQGGTEFVLTNAEAGSKKLAFDHDKLATVISTVTGHSYTGLTLPFAPMQGGRGGGGRAAPGAAPTTAPLTFLDGEKSIQFGTGGFLYKCALLDYTCSRVGPIPQPGNGGSGGRGGSGPIDETLISPEGAGGDPVDGLEYQPPAPQDGDEGIFGRGTRSCAPQPARAANATSRNTRVAMGGQFPGQLHPDPAEVCTSFDGNGRRTFRTSISTSSR